MQQILYEVKKVIVGQDHLLERVLIALLAQGHLLVEGVPGLAKTLTIKTLAQALACTFKRIQFTPDLLPADLVGTRIFNQRSGEFSTWLGPVFTNLLLADEINRSPAKVQSALLEVMQERQVSIGGQTHKVPEPFLVMATQNPIETEGTYPLPEAQVDRFMMKVLVDYPSELEEFVIVQRMTSGLEQVSCVVGVEQLLALRAEADAVYVDPALIEYAVRLATATRRPDSYGLPDLARYITYGASPRASINLILTARALAYVRGRAYAVPQDVADMALDVMRHRLVLSYEALSDGVTADAILQRILEAVPAPSVPMQPGREPGAAAAGEAPTAGEAATAPEAAAAEAEANVPGRKES
jgi:MoxR-like ATPase